jgi:hypothetical protein
VEQGLEVDGSEDANRMDMETCLEGVAETGRNGEKASAAVTRYGCRRREKLRRVWRQRGRTRLLLP